MGKSLQEIARFISHNKNNLGQSLRALEQSGDINSDGDISTREAINAVSGYGIECLLHDNSNLRGEYLIIDLISGRNNIALVISNNGKLYLPK
jgi:hypothetical protein